MNIPEETKKQWCEEFYKINKVTPETVRCSFTLSPALDGYIQAKTSSYQREHDLKTDAQYWKEMNDESIGHWNRVFSENGKLREHTDRREECSNLTYENEKLQERIIDLEAQIQNVKTDYTLSIDRYNKLQERIKESEKAYNILNNEFIKSMDDCNSDIAKRDVLLNLAKNIMRNAREDEYVEKVDNLCKKLQELREKK